MIRAARACLVLPLLMAGLSGCGFLAASAKPEMKPDAFILRGHVSVPVRSGDTRPDGAACAATVPGVVAGTTIRVTAPDGRLLGAGTLDYGIIGHDGGVSSSCEFAFQVPGVRGGVASYGVAVANRPPQQFPAKDLRENAEAIVRITG